VETINVNQAVKSRVAELLSSKRMTQYRLEQESGLSHGLIGCIMRDRNKNVTLKTIMMLAQGFGITLLEFLDSPFFTDKRIDLE